MEEKVPLQALEFVYIDPELLKDQIRTIEIMEKVKIAKQNLKKNVKEYFKAIDR